MSVQKGVAEWILDEEQEQCICRLQVLVHMWTKFTDRVKTTKT